MKRLALLVAAGCASTGCATIGGDPYVGRPIADAVRELGSPEAIADYQSGGRYFTWSTSDVVLMGPGADNPANWLNPPTRVNAPENLEEARSISLPDSVVSPGFRPGPCSFTLVAEWDAGAKAWVARKAIRKGAGQGGHCGLRFIKD